MNMHQPTKAFTPDPASNDTFIEQAILHAVLKFPERLSEFAAVAVPSDFTHPIHSLIAEHLIETREAGREPSITSLLAFVGEEELEPGLPARKYIGNLVMGPTSNGAMMRLTTSWRDTLDAWRDHVNRQKLTKIGEQLQWGSMSMRDMNRLASEGVDQLDEVMAAYRTGKLRQYDALGAADIALAHLDSDTPAYPTTGLVDLDRMIGGWPRGQLTVIAGRPGMGKSCLATSVVLKAAKAGHACAFFSLEMVGEQLGSRMLTDLAYTANMPIYYQDVLHRRLTSHQRQRLVAQRDALKGLPLVNVEQRNLTISEIASKARRIANDLDRQGRKLEIICVDHLGIMSASGRHNGNRVREVAEISNGLATLASELDVAVIALSQLNRGVEGRENKRPMLADLRDSGSIEEDASLVIFAYRPAYYLERQESDSRDAEAERLELLEKHRHTLELSVAKNRNGRIGAINVYCDIGANAVRDAAYATGCPPRDNPKSPSAGR